MQAVSPSLQLIRHSFNLICVYPIAFAFGYFFILFILLYNEKVANIFCCHLFFADYFFLFAFTIAIATLAANAVATPTFFATFIACDTELGE